ncbi:restriction endonuclease [Acrocarpospora pleiomorpha]|uniref:Restriction endonuclease n=1 Tax=Acrocarpospora pleiomorpha TaxID=90975 RepID=A0A5M3XGN3_9ACTN|nr:restriction endonuclease [Acrocarpospora pleiomorpha]GES20687.1 restriction endonuclease [Acrocarpospora pleiomorpha]
MAGSRSDWERYQAAQRREAERRAREAAKLAKEQQRVLQQQHLEQQQATTDNRTAEVVKRIEELDGVLAVALGVYPLAFEQMRVIPPLQPFSPGRLGVPELAPDWASFAPSPPTGFSKLLGGKARYERDSVLARDSFDAAMAAYRQREAQRVSRLSDAQVAHDRRMGDLRDRAAAENAQLDKLRADFVAGQPEAVEWFIGKVLERSTYPHGCPRLYQVAYRPENHDLVVEFELPGQDVIPQMRGYKYVKQRDAIDPVPRPQTEIRQRYAKLLACVTLRTLHEIFTATPAQIVEAIVFNGRHSTIDRATGKNVRPHLLSVQAERPSFEELVLSAVDPIACLKRLNALVSPNPYDLEAIEPFITFDLNRFRFSEDMDVVAGLDSRRNLLKLSPTEFEHLVRELFVAMGAEAWTTIPSKDGGVDAVATSKNLFFGGVCLIQAKRWAGLVGLDAVHALTGVMADHNATTGVLVTTSWFGRASENFAQRNRITLINGAELKHLIKQHLNIDVIPGTHHRETRGHRTTHRPDAQVRQSDPRWTPAR